MRTSCRYVKPGRFRQASYVKDDITRCANFTVIREAPYFDNFYRLIMKWEGTGIHIFHTNTSMWSDILKVPGQYCQSAINFL